MSTLEAKPVKKRILNSKLLPLAAVLLIVLALLFMATPLVRVTGAAGQGGNFVLRNGGQTLPAPANGAPTLPGQGGAPAARRFSAGGGMFAGFIGPVIYFVALLISLAATLGMLFLKRWGQVLGTIMAVLYLLLGLLSLLPLIFMSFIGVRNPLSLILGVVHVLLAIAVIVLAAIPGKPASMPEVMEPPAPASA